MSVDDGSRVTVAVSSVVSASSAAATVTVWAVFQVVVVNVSVFWVPGVLASVSAMVTSPPPLKLTVTLAVGWLPSRTVKVLVLPSVTVRVVADRVRPAVSLSSTVTATVEFARAL